MVELIEIHLGSREMIQAAFVGIMRQVENLKLGRRDRNGIDSATEGWQRHIEGAMGEMALAKVLGIFWSGAHSFRGRDVGDWQARTTAQHSHSLIVRPDDSDADRFVLLTGANGRYRIRGWIYGRDAKSPDYRGDPNGRGEAYFVPQDRLVPMPVALVPTNVDAA